MPKKYKRAKQSLSAGKERSVSELRPLADLGFRGYEEISSLLGLGTQSSREEAVNRFYSTPGVQFAQDEAARATSRQLGASGFGRSGNVLAALQDRSQQLASQQFGGYLQQLSSFAQPGLQAKGQIADLEYQYGKDYGQLQIAEAEAKNAKKFNWAKAIGTVIATVATGGTYLAAAGAAVAAGATGSGGGGGVQFGGGRASSTGSLGSTGSGFSNLFGSTSGGGGGGLQYGLQGGFDQNTNPLSGTFFTGKVPTGG